MVQAGQYNFTVEKQALLHSNIYGNTFPKLSKNNCWDKDKREWTRMCYFIKREKSECSWMSSSFQDVSYDFCLQSKTKNVLLYNCMRAIFFKNCYCENPF